MSSPAAGITPSAQTATSIKLRIFVALLGLGALFGGLTTVVATGRALDAARQEALATLNTYSRHFASAVDREIAMQVDGVVARAPVISHWVRTADWQTTRQWLDGYVTRNPEVAWAGFADKSGTIRAASRQMLEGDDVTQRPWFVSGLKGLWLGDVHEAMMLATKLDAPPGGEPLRFLDVATPIYTAQGEVAGVFAIHLHWYLVGQSEGTLRAQLQRERIDTLLVGSSNVVIAGTPALRGQRLNDTLLQSTSVGSSEWSATPITWPDGVQYVAAVKNNEGHGSFPGFGWRTVVRAPLAVLDEEANRIKTRMIGISTLTLALAALAAWLIAGQLSKPIRRMADNARKIGAGVPPQPVGALPAELIPLQGALTELEQSVAKRQSYLKTIVHLSDMRLRTLSALVPGVLLQTQMVNGRCEVSFASPTSERVFGHSQESLRGPVERFANLIDDAADRERVIKAFTAGGDPPGSHEIDHFAVRSADDSGLVWLRAIGNVDTDTRGTVLTTWLLLDVTTNRVLVDQLQEAVLAAQTERQRAERASTAKTDFLAAMSHEIRTPLNAVIGFADLLTNEPLNERQHTWAHYIAETADTLSHIVNDILDLSKIEAGKLSVDRAPFDPAPIINSCAHVFMAMAAQKHITLEFDTGEANLRALGDPVRARQVLFNLLSNAVKFTHRGVVRISCAAVDASAPSHASRCVRFSVTDQGIGIAPERIDRLFDQAFQTDADTARVYGGTGLGLQISKRLVELMGGTIGVESTLDKGSHFWFDLPEIGHETTESPLDALETADSAETTFDPPLSVLVADDVEANRRYVKAVAAQMGCAADEAEDGVEALHLYQSKPYDIIIVDEQMPHMDGVELTRRVREKRSRQDVAIIALTANAFEDSVDRFTQAGANAHVAKPVRSHELRALISHWGIMIRRHRETATAMSITPGIDHQNLLDNRYLRDLQTTMSDDEVQNLRSSVLRSIDDIGNTVRDLSAGRDVDRAELGKRLHRLAGSAGLLGAIPLSKHTRLVMRQLPDGATHADFAANVATLESLLDRTAGALREQSQAPR